MPRKAQFRSAPERSAETTDGAWDAVLETNLISPYRYAVACLPHLRAAGGGAVVAISSDAGVWVETAIGAYSVSKRALITLAQMLGVEAGKDGIRVNVVCPGDTAPGMATTTAGRMDLDPAGWLLPPAGRIGTAQDSAASWRLWYLAEPWSGCPSQVKVQTVARVRRPSPGKASWATTQPSWMS